MVFVLIQDFRFRTSDPKILCSCWNNSNTEATSSNIINNYTSFKMGEQGAHSWKSASKEPCKHLLGGSHHWERSGDALCVLRQRQIPGIAVFMFPKRSGHFSSVLVFFGVTYDILHWAQLISLQRASWVTIFQLWHIAVWASTTVSASSIFFSPFSVLPPFSFHLTCTVLWFLVDPNKYITILSFFP